MPVRNLGRQGVLLASIALVVMVAGAVVLVIALRAQTSAPVARDAGTIDPPTASASASPSSRSSAVVEPLGASRPQTIEIPALGLKSRVNPIGLAKDGTIAVPAPGPKLNQAAWFTNSPTPGQPGPSVIEGHVDSVSGPSVFFDLGKVKPGQKIRIVRADGRTVTFTVDAVRNYLKAKFPTQVVYGAKNLSTPALRLITCSQFDQATHHHVGNAVVFAHLTHVSGRS